MSNKTVLINSKLLVTTFTCVFLRVLVNCLAPRCGIPGSLYTAAVELACGRSVEVYWGFLALFLVGQFAISFLSLPHRSIFTDVDLDTLASGHRFRGLRNNNISILYTGSSLDEATSDDSVNYAGGLDVISEKIN